MVSGGTAKRSVEHGANEAGEKVGQAADQAGDTAERVQRSRPYRFLAGVGLISFGVVHLLIATIALQVAWSGGGDASSQGALGQLAKTPVGPPILIIIAIGLVTLAGWQLIDALWGFSELDGAKRARRRLSSAGRVLVYLALAVSAIKIVAGSGSSSGKSENTWTARLLQLPLGPALVMVVAAAIVAVGISQVVKGVKQTFTDDLASSVSAPVRRLGQVGYGAKGVALLVVGGLFAWAAITVDPKKAGGMDAALKTIRSSPFGSVLLTVMALGIACFGFFCFAWAKNPKRH